MKKVFTLLILVTPLLHWTWSVKALAADDMQYTITDPSFAEWLDATYPGLIINSNQLDLVEAAQITEMRIEFVDGLGSLYQQVTNLDGLQHFTNLRVFTSVLAGINHVPDLSNLQAIETFELKYSLLSFEQIFALENTFTSDVLKIENRSFSFRPVEPFVSLRHNINGFDLGANITLKNNSLIQIHEQSVIHWYKNDELIRSGKSDSLVITDFKMSDIASYSAKVSNSLAPGDTLFFASQMITYNNTPTWWADELVLVNNNIDSTFLVSMINNQQLAEEAIRPGDFLGVFFEDELGILQPGAVGIWDGMVLLSFSILPGDLDNIDPKVGFDNLEPLQFKLWDPVSETTNDVTVEYVQDPVEALSLLESTGFVGEEYLDNLTFFSDGLFHPIDAANVSPDQGNGLFWSVIANVVGRPQTPFTIQDDAFANWLRSNYPGSININNELNEVFAATIEVMNMGKVQVNDLDGLQYFTGLREFTIESQELQRVPDLSGLTVLETFVATSAKLSFTHIIALNNLQLDSLNLDNSFFSLNVGGTPKPMFETIFLSIGDELGFSNSGLIDIHPQSVFHWYKNSEQLTTSNTLTVTDFERSKIAEYSLRITNPLMPGDTLKSFSYLATIDNKPSWWRDDFISSSSFVDDHFVVGYTNPDLKADAIEPGDFVGFFYEDEQGVLQTHAGAIWTGERLGSYGVILRGDTDGIDPKFGFEDNEVIQYQLWDPIRSENYAINAEYASPVDAENLVRSSYDERDQILVDIMDEDEVFLVVHDDGLYHPSFTIPNNSTNPPRDDLQWSFSVVTNWVGKNVSPWEVTVGGPESHLIIVPSDVSSDINGSALEVGDYIGFFFESESGDLICSDYARWTGENLALSAWITSGTPKSGYDVGEELVMKVWKASADKEYLVNEIDYVDTPPFNASGLFEANALSRISSIRVNPSCLPQEIKLYPGWNLISTYLEPTDKQMSSIFNGITPVLVKNDLGNIVYAPQNGITSGVWNEQEGYQVFVMSEQTLSVCGDVIEDGREIVLNVNTYPYFLPYWYESPFPLETVLQDVTSDVDYIQQVKYDAGQQRFVASNYIPNHIISPPIDQIGNMEPGLAYKLKMNKQSSYTKNTLNTSNGRLAAKSAYERRKLEYYKIARQRSIDNAIVVIPNAVLQRVEGLAVEDEIAVKTSSGILLGAAVYHGEDVLLTAWDIEGLEQQDELEIEYWSKEKLAIQSLKSEFKKSNRYQTNELMIVEELESINSGEGVFIYPNPAKERLNISLIEPTVTTANVSLLDLNGRVLSTHTIEVGVKSAALNLGNIDAGVYLVSITYEQEGQQHFVRQRIVIVD